MSLGAYICFGFPLKYPEDYKEEFDWDIHEENWEKVYAERKFGITEPTEEFDKNNPEILKKYRDYWDKTSEIKKSRGSRLPWTFFRYKTSDNRYRP